uniref:Uncharacterized protein n=1 Tax=Saimiri boliviensis boliviensis TaxID=39432 RepID=A0A2K6RYY9_SAIBB
MAPFPLCSVCTEKSPWSMCLQSQYCLCRRPGRAIWGGGEEAEQNMPR